MGKFRDNDDPNSSPSLYVRADFGQMFSRGRGGGQGISPVVGMVRQSERASGGGGVSGRGSMVVVVVVLPSNCRASCGGGFGMFVSHCKDGGGGVLVSCSDDSGCTRFPKSQTGV